MVIVKAPCTEFRRNLIRQWFSTLCQGGCDKRCRAGVNLHSVNGVVVIDDADLVLYQKCVRNDRSLLLMALNLYRAAAVQIIAIEFTLSVPLTISWARL